MSHFFPMAVRVVREMLPMTACPAEVRGSKTGAPPPAAAAAAAAAPAPVTMEAIRAGADGPGPEAGRA